MILHMLKRFVNKAIMYIISAIISWIASAKSIYWCTNPWIKLHLKVKWKNTFLGNIKNSSSVYMALYEFWDKMLRIFNILLMYKLNIKYH